MSASKFKRYPTYQNTDQRWLGEVPKHWGLKRVGYYFEERREKVSDKDFSPLSVTKNGIVPQLQNAAKSDDGDNRKLVRKGDFVINSRSDRKGSSGLSQLDGSISLINTVITPSSELRGAYIHHLFRSTPFQEEYYRFGKGIVADLWSTNYSEFKNIVIPIPSTDEQLKIANFLDIEIAKIDDLIHKQQLLIDQLRLKKYVEISSAVTVGLEKPNKKKYISDWLTAIPAHWEVKKLKHIANIFASNVDKKTLEGQKSIKLCNYTDVYYHDKITEELEFMCASATEDQIVKFELKAGDVIITKDSETPDDIGIAAFVPNDIKGVICGYHLSIVRPKQDIDGSFLKRLFDSNYVKSSWMVLANGVTRYGLGQYAIGNLKVPVPPIDEQIKIVQYLDGLAESIDSLMNKSLKSIEILKERRASLISAAVTGKIDVRELA